MMQMFKYPQGEGGLFGRIDANLPPFIGPSYPFIYALPLLSRFVTRSLCPQTVVGMGGMRHGC